MDTDLAALAAVHEVRVAGLIWGKKTEFGAHTISQHVYALRKKLEFDKHGFNLQSVYATGYRLECFATPSRSRGVPPHARTSAPDVSVWR